MVSGWQDAQSVWLSHSQAKKSGAACPSVLYRVPVYPYFLSDPGSILPALRSLRKALTCPPGIPYGASALCHRHKGLQRLNPMNHKPERCVLSQVLRLEGNPRLGQEGFPVALLSALPGLRAVAVDAPLRAAASGLPLV